MNKLQISYKDYYDKVLGGWIGKCAGGILGAPIEGFKTFNEIKISDALFATNFANDDLDLQVLWLDMVKKKGPQVNESDMREHWMKHVEFPWGEYGVASRNLKLGLDIPDSGRHNNHYWYRGMGSPIRSEIWGMLCPGDPLNAMRYAKMDSELDHHGFSVEAEMFLSAAAAIAFFENDISKVLMKAISYFSNNSEIRVLVQTVTAWSLNFDKNIVAGKIKSRYGDADFTSAPQNIAFTILALLTSQNSMDGIMEALHYGHDSDCVVATAGALLGIVNGFENIPSSWKTRVGNELLVSPEIVNIDHTDTITGLTEETCRSGISFIQHNNQVTLTGNKAEQYPIKIDPVSVRTHVLEYPIAGTAKNGSIEVILTNRTAKEIHGKMELSSNFFMSQAQDVKLQPNKESKCVVELIWSGLLHLDQNPASYEYSVSFNDVQIDRGIPAYGSWMLFGPFIKDDPALVPMHEKYPDHGLDSLPSFNYMNRDKLNIDQVFISISQIKSLIETGTLAQQSFDVQTIFAEAFKIDLCKYFIGRGERSLYLYTTLYAEAPVSKWLTIGCSAYFKIFHDENMVYEATEIVRSWPYGHFTKLALHQGLNHLLIKIDAPTDQFDFEIGLKEFNGKHPHQSQWETQMIFKAD